ncbi:MAG: diguanylate cyclase, partial [Solirubrobacteraceae bacterium]|nr:diguanylate cyclase [Solirubrobacteraceae bacterium]
MLGRAEFAVLPWLVVAVSLLAGALSEWLRGDLAGRDWVAIVGALGGAVLALGLAAAQHLAANRRPRTSLWLYGAATSVVVLGLVALAVRSEGLNSPYYAGMMPLATYLGLIVPARTRGWLLGGLFAITLGVHLATPAATFAGAAVVWAMVAAGWACGVLSSLEHARIATVARRRGDYDTTTNALNRRAFLEHVDRALASPPAREQPIAVLLVDLVAFSQVNADLGEDAADEVLAQVGATFASILPSDAELGRLGDDR